jgi:hypothetical protein
MNKKQQPLEHSDSGQNIKIQQLKEMASTSNFMEVSRLKFSPLPHYGISP